MQFVSFFGMRLPAITKGQTGLWMALVGLLFSSMLCAQGVDVIDHKGTKNTITTVSTDAGNLITTGSDEGAYLNYQNIRSNTTVQEGSGFGIGNPYKIGIPSSSNLVDLDINEADIVIFTNPSGGSATIRVDLQSLGTNDSYLGKTVQIVQYNNSRPKIITYDSDLNSQDYTGGGTLDDLFFDTNKKYESVTFIWANNNGTRQWFPMQ